MSEVGIDSGSLAAGFIEDSATFNFQYQYARVTDEFVKLFDMDDTDIVANGVAIGDEVVRRIMQNIIEKRWPARTKSAAASILEQARVDTEHSTATATRGAPGWYDVTATQFLIDPGGWSPWIKVEDLDPFDTN
jgi:hypothetical protein